VTSQLYSLLVKIMEISLAQKAVSLALGGEWKKALEVNLTILKENPDDIDSLNRLARCYAETGDAKMAIETTQKVLNLDPVNPIAQRCILKWKSAKHEENHQSTAVSPEAFLEESGKTKMVTLLNPGDQSVLVNLDSGDEVMLTAHSHKVSVVDTGGKYVGCLSDDLAARIRNLLKKGNKYQVLVTSVDTKDVSVLIRETENKTGTASFTPEKIDYVTFTPPELVHKDVPEMETTEEIAE